MKSLIKKLGSCVLPRDQLLPLLEAHLSKKPKKCDLPWVEVVKRLLNRAADENCKVLFENASTIIRIHLNETVRKGLKNRTQLSQKYSDILNSLLTHLHFTMENTNFQVVEMHSLSSLILAAVIDMSIAAHKKGEEASVVAKIFMKLTMILGHSQEQLLDALLHSRTLIHPSSRQPSIQVPLIKRLFSSVRSGQAMTPVLYLKYLLLGKLWLFMTEKKELGKTRTYIAKLLRPPEGIPEWAERERVPWLTLSQWNTRLILKSMTLLGALETFYGDISEEISVDRDHQSKNKKSSSTLPQKIKPGICKSFAKRNVDAKVKTEDSKEFLRPPVIEVDSNEDVKHEPQIMDINNFVADEEALPCSIRTNESVEKQKNKRKSVKALSQKGKKRKVLNHVEEEEASLPVPNKSTLLQKTKSGSSKSSVNKNVSGEKKINNTCYNIADGFPKPLISEVNSDEDVKQDFQTLAVDHHFADDRTLLCNKRTVESVGKKGGKRKSMEALVQKVKKRKVENKREEKETNVALINKKKITQKKKHKNLQKEYKKISNIKTGNSNKSNAAHIDVSETAEFLCESSCTSGVMPETEGLPENIIFSHPVERQLQVLKKLHKKKSRKRQKNSLVHEEDSKDKIRRNSCQFEEVSEYSADAVSLETLNQKEGKGSSRKQKLSKKQQRIRRKSMTFTVTDLKVKRDNIVEEEFENIDSKDNEEPSVSENNETDTVMPTGKQSIKILRNVGTDSNKELNWNNVSAIEFYRLQNLRANKCDTDSEDSSDYDRSNGNEDSNLESFEVPSVLEKLTSCREKVENVSKMDSDDQAVNKRDSEQEDASEGSSEDSYESDKETVLKAKCNTAETSEHDSYVSFVTDNDTDDSNEKLKVECKNTENCVAVDGVKSDEDDEVIVEIGSKDVNGECDSMLGTSNRSDIFAKVNDKIPSNTPEKLIEIPCDNSKEYEDISDEESNSGEIIITKCMVRKLHNKDVKIDSSTEEATDLNNSDQNEDSKDSMVTEVEVIEHSKHYDIGKVEDSKISSNFHAVTVPPSGYEIKTAMDEVISKTNEVPQPTICDSDCDILEASGTDQDIISCKESDHLSTSEDSKIYNELKTEPVQREVENLVQEEMKQEREPKQSPIDEKNTKKTASVLHHKCSEHKSDASQDLVSKMINNLYKSNVKIQDEDKEGKIQVNYSKILSNQHSSVAETTDCLEDEKKRVSCKQNPALEDSVSRQCTYSPSATTDDDDDKSVVIVDDSEEIESMLQNIVQDTGRLASIRGLRERLLSETMVKEEAKENSDHEIEKDDKELIKDNEISPSCDSQVKTHDSVNHQSTESLGSTGDMNGKSVAHVDDKEDTESLLQSIVKDEDQLAGIRGLRERLLSKATMREETLESSEHKDKKDGKEAAQDSEASPYDSQMKTTKENSKNQQLKEVVDETLLCKDKSSPSKSSTGTYNKKDDLMDEMHTVMGEIDNCLSILSTENNSSMPNNDEVEKTDGSSKDISTIDKEQECSDSKNVQDRELNKSHSDEQVSITSDTGSKEKNLISASGVEVTEETSPKPLEVESAATNGAETLSDPNAAANCNISLIFESSNTEVESVIEESGDKSTEGADEAYEASSDASEDPAPRTRRRSRSLRKSCPHQGLQQASDSDSSPVRAACRRTSAMDSTNHQKPRRKRSQSCSLENISQGMEAHNRTQTLENSLENSVNKTFTIEKEYSFNKTFTVEAKKILYTEASSAAQDSKCHSSGEKLLMKPNENKQDALSEDDDEVAIVKDKKLNPSEDVPELDKSEPNLLHVSQRRQSQEDTPLPSVKVVINETRTDSSESSLNTSSLSSQNKELLHVLTLVERTISSPSDTTLTETFIEPSSPCRINSDDVSEAELHSVSKDGLPSKIVEDIASKSDTTLTDPFIEPSSPCRINSDDVSEAELHSISKDGLPSKVVEDTASKSCASYNEGESTIKLAVLSSENSGKSQNCEVLIKEQNSLSEEGNQKFLSDIKGNEHEEPHPDNLMMEAHDTDDNAGSAQDSQNGTEYEEIRRVIHKSEKVIDNNLNQEVAEEFYEGEEVEVLSTSGIEEEDEGETVRVTPEAFDDNEVEARKADLLISKKSLRSHIRQLYPSKDGKDVSRDLGNRDGKLVQIPVVKAHCLSEVALTKEVLISPDVSDEECELVSPGVDLNDGKVAIEVDTVQDNVPHKNVSLCLSNLSMQKSSGGINSPHKTIPEEQDESTIPKISSENFPKASPLKRTKNSVTPPSLSLSSTEKSDDRNIRTRRSLRGITGDDHSGSPQNLEMPKSAKSNTKLSKVYSNIQEEPTVISNPERLLDASNKSTVEIKGQKRKETVTDTPKKLRSLTGTHDSSSVTSHCIGKESKDKRLRTNSPCNAGSTGIELNGQVNASHERILLSPQKQNSEPLCENSDNRYIPDRSEITKSQLAKNSVPDASGDTIVKEDEETEKNQLSSHSEEDSSGCDTPHQSVTGPQKGLSSSSSLSQLLLPVRRSSRLRKQPNGLSYLTKDSRNPGSSSVLSESEQESEEVEDKNATENLKSLRRSVRTTGTPRKAPSDARLLTE